MDRTNQDKAVLVRIRYAWAHADRAMEKIDADRRGRIWQIVAGDRKPSSLDLALIADATGRTVNWLLHGEEDEETNPWEHPTRCEHKDTWFDRTVCPEPCGGMHTYCNDCGKRVGACLLDDLQVSLRQLRDGLAVPAQTLEEEQAAETSHVFVPTGPGMCAVCRLSVHAETHGGYPQVCITCGHATRHQSGGIGVCEFSGCGCDGPTNEQHAKAQQEAWEEIDRLGREREATAPSEVLSLCERCHGEVYTFPRKLLSLSQRREDPTDRWASFVYADSDGDELVISDAVDDTGPAEVCGVNICTPPDGVFVPLDVLEAVVDALRVSGQRSTLGDES